MAATEQQKQYYRKQREEAEAGAKKGDVRSAAMASKIYGKLGNKKKAQGYEQLGELSLKGQHIGQGIEAAKKAASIAGTAATIGSLPGLARGAAGLAAGARGLIPRAAEGISGLIKNLSGQAVKRGAQAASRVGRTAGKMARSEASGPASAAKAATKTAKSATKGTTKKSSLPARTVKSVSTKGKVVRTSPSKTTPMEGAAKSRKTGQSMRPMQPGTKKAQRFVARQGSKTKPPKSSLSRKKTAKKTED